MFQVVSWRARDGDRARVAELLGRPPRSAFTVVVRDPAGDPVVIRNAPLLEDGSPMPTRYWLVGKEARLAVDRLESSGGVRAAELAVDPAELDAAHKAYAEERDLDLPSGWIGPRPSGGVGGTRRGVKCLHAHYAWHLAGGDDPVGRWVAEQLVATNALGAPEPSVAPVAAIDCGTQSTRLLIAYAGGATVERLNRITRLGQGVDRTATLAPDAIDRTVGVLREYKAALDRHGVRRVRVTATSAARDATNREEFFSAAESVVGVRPQLIGGAEEGRLSFEGATSELDPSSAPWLVVDIGGGSTELIVGPGPRGGPLAVTSLDVGCVRISERYLASDPPTPDDIEAARLFARGFIEQATEAEPAFYTGSTLVGLAGTVACLASVDQGLESYDRRRVHHYVLTLERVDEMLRALMSMTSEQRRLVPGVEPQRADVIVGGTIVLDEIMRHFGFGHCLTSEADILDGIVLGFASGTP
jgi:exopolyphosphatase/guanosine-5'-triphosphate,3'-diphosphate pyrophosphatase